MKKPNATGPAEYVWVEKTNVIVGTAAVDIPRGRQVRRDSNGWVWPMPAADATPDASTPRS